MSIKFSNISFQGTEVEVNFSLGYCQHCNIRLSKSKIEEKSEEGLKRAIIKYMEEELKNTKIELDSKKWIE